MAKLKFVGMMNIKDEERWIARVLESALKVCEVVCVIDDHSLDRTKQICREFDRVELWPSPFEPKKNKTRDKNFIYGKAKAHDPDWIVTVDGDEILEDDTLSILEKEVEETVTSAFALQILYVWNQEGWIRTDGVYRHFYRPSVFRHFRDSRIKYQGTPWRGNLHCPNVPQELLHQHGRSKARILHYGYYDRSLRLKKYNALMEVDPNNEGEDCYRHVIQGDVDQIPPQATLKHAGPLEITALGALKRV
jgi:glycosyltransferase involved in cell wall biosynthesis